MVKSKALRRFVWVQSHGTAKRRKQRTEGAETRRSEEGKILAGKYETFPPLNSASPRLLFDFSRFDEPPKIEKRPTRNAAEPKVTFR
jgi:hypothetical protein